MIGIFLASLATLIGEVGHSIGKNEVAHRRESILGMGFLNILWGVIIYVIIAVFVSPDTFVGSIFGEYRFSFEFVPLSLFLIRVCLEVLVINLVLRGVVAATRSSFSFLRMLTIPFLLGADILLGYQISVQEFIGIAVILITTISLVASSTIKRDGMWYVIGMALLAVFTVSIYKYNITNYNSVMGEQLTMSVIMMIYLGVAATVTTKKNPLRHFKRPIVVLQSLASGLDSVITSVAFVFAPGSIIMTARRTSAILWSVLAGNIVFGEQKLLLKIAGLGVLCIGLCFLVF